MKVELFYSPGCQKCAATREELKAVAQHADPTLVWQELNVLEELDYAVELGVLALPAIAIDRELVFSSLPAPAELAKELRRRLTDGA